MNDLSPAPKPWLGLQKVINKIKRKLILSKQMIHKAIFLSNKILYIVVFPTLSGSSLAEEVEVFMFSC